MLQPRDSSSERLGWSKTTLVYSVGVRIHTKASWLGVKGLWARRFSQVIHFPRKTVAGLNIRILLRKQSSTLNLERYRHRLIPEP